MEKTLLIVDDEDYMRTLGEKVADELGYAPITASNGNEAVEKAKKADLILMDTDMPEKNGLEALAEIKEKYNGKKVIMMSGRITPERIEEYKRLDADDYIAKPFDIEEIESMLKKYSNFTG